MVVQLPWPTTKLVNTEPTFVKGVLKNCIILNSCGYVFHYNHLIGFNELLVNYFGKPTTLFQTILLNHPKFHST